MESAPGPIIRTLLNKSNAQVLETENSLCPAASVVLTRCYTDFRIRGAYLVKPYIENEVYERTKRKGALAEEAARVASGMSRTLASAMAQKTPAPSKQGKADAKTKVRSW